MRTLPLVLGVLMLLGPAISGAIPVKDPRQTGPAGDITFYDETLTVPATGDFYFYRVIFPGVEQQFAPGTGALPVVVLSHGYQAPSFSLFSYGEMLASWGYLVIHPQRPGTQEDFPALIADLQYVLDWVAAENADVNSTLHGHADLSRIGVGGHSQGGSLSFAVCQRDVRPKCIVGLDPVDTDFTSRSTISGMARVKVPFIVLGTDETTGTCNPPAQNFERFYALGSSPKVSVTVLGGDHCALMREQLMVDVCRLLCQDTTNPTRQNEICERATIAWFNRYLYDEPGFDAWTWGTHAADEVLSGQTTLTYDLGEGTPTPISATYTPTPPPPPTATPTPSGPTATPTPSPTPVAASFEVDAGFTAHTLTVAVRLRNSGADTRPMALYCLMELAGEFYTVPDFQMAVLPLVSDLTVPGGLDTGWLELLTIPGVDLGGNQVTLTFYAAMVDMASGGLIGPVGNESVVVF